MNLSFAGCGFLGIYHVGVAVCFKKYAPHLLLQKISGASAGSLAACCLLCEVPLGEMTSEFCRVVDEARRLSLGPFSPSFNIQTCLIKGLQKHLPADVHKRVNGRLHISLTRVYDGKNVIVSQFNSREDVLQALLCACFIPGFSGLLPPRYHGVRYMDGGFSDNLPILDENTITVSPFCGESDICPRDQSSQLFHVNWANTSIELSKQNINRFARILFPPKPETLSKLCQQGFDDALQYLHRNNLISCTRCLAVQSTFVVSDTVPDVQDYDPECKECTKHRKDALIGKLPETVLTVCQTYIDAANKGLINWICKHKGFKLLHALSLPATVPVDIVYATVTKILSFLPSFNQLCEIAKYILSHINAILKSHALEKAQISAHLSCELSLTESRDTMKSSSRYGSRLSIFKDDDLFRHPLDVDAFENILQMTSHHETLYAYYYTDESNAVNVTEIIDLTETDYNTMSNPHSHHHNTNISSSSDTEREQTEYLRSRNNYNNSYNSIIDKSDNIEDESESLWPGVEINEIGSDLSDPEADQSHPL